MDNPKSTELPRKKWKRKQAQQSFPQPVSSADKVSYGEALASGEQMPFHGVCMYVHTYLHAYIHACMHKYTHARAHIHTG